MMLAALAMLLAVQEAPADGLVPEDDLLYQDDLSDRPGREDIEPVQLPLLGECDAIETPVDRRSCLDALFQEEDLKLRVAERDYLAFQDRQGGRMFKRVDEDQYKQNFRAESDAWIAYRDSHCRRTEMEGPDPRGEGLRELTCKIVMTEARIADFEYWIGPVEDAE